MYTELHVNLFLGVVFTILDPYDKQIPILGVGFHE